MARRVSFNAGNSVEKHVRWFYLLPSIEFWRVDGSSEDDIPSETNIDFDWLVFYFRITIERDL